MAGILIIDEAKKQELDELMYAECGLRPIPRGDGTYFVPVEVKDAEAVSRFWGFLETLEETEIE